MAFRDRAIQLKLLWMTKEIRCMLGNYDGHVSIADIYSLPEAMQSIKLYIRKTYGKCSSCSRTKKRVGHYLKPTDLIDLLELLDCPPERIDQYMYEIPKSMRICVDCAVCSLMYKEPLLLLQSFLDDIIILNADEFTHSISSVEEWISSHPA
ncbi:TPA_asm: protein 3 [Pennisetum virus 1]|uniref:Protein 3 n=1 Tax=Pennisetum virus 1 TaxID=2977978 RepID=A0A9N6YJC6_9RHAB|nr:TPA_asm: protein 3 [Pennisetum virus 1]